jgi:hypothetical protein
MSFISRRKYYGVVFLSYEIPHDMADSVRGDNS